MPAVRFNSANGLLNLHEAAVAIAFWLFHSGRWWRLKIAVLNAYKCHRLLQKLVLIDIRCSKLRLTTSTYVLQNYIL